jgi:hypothetical protein
VRTAGPASVAVPAAGYLDLPVRAPSLQHRGELLAARQQGTVARTVRRFKPKVGASRY